MTLEHNADQTKLTEIREQLDALDKQLIELLARRFQIGGQAARMKRRMGIPVHDPAREEHVLPQAKEWARVAGLPESAVAELFMRLISLSRGAQLAAADEQ